MKLTGVKGESAFINTSLMEHALEYTPSLVLDCANASNTHSYSHYFSPEKFERVFIINIDLIYKFRDALKVTRGFAKKLKVKNIIITTFNHLFHYQDPRENRDIFEHSWELMKDLSKYFNILVGVHHSHSALAEKFCDKIVRIHNGTYTLKPKTSTGFYTRRPQSVLESPSARREANLRRSPSKAPVLLWQRKLC